MRKQGFRAMGLLGALAAVISLNAAGVDTSLIEAVKARNLQAIRTLVKKPGVVNAPEPDGTTALHWAARANDLETIQLLLRSGANAKAANRFGETALGLAAVNGNATILEALLKAGADPNAATPEGQTPLMNAARAGHADAIKTLVAFGAKVTSTENFMGENALMWAANENHPEAVKTLVELGADINSKSKETKYPPLKFTPGGMIITYLPVGGWTPVMYAARNGAMEAVKTLIDKKADLNAVDPDGATALMFAIINAHFDVAKVLIEAGSNLNIQDRTGTSALYSAVDMHSVDEGMGRPLPKVEGDNIAIIKLMLEKGANPNLQLKMPTIGRHHAASGDANLGLGTTPLMRAAKNGDTEIIGLLLEHGANPKLTQKDGTNAVMIAASPSTGQYGRLSAEEWKCVEGVRMMVKAGVDINAQNERGETAIHRAVLRNRFETINGLFGYGARLDIQNKQGLNPLDAALAVGQGRRGGANTAVINKTTVELLRDLGATETPLSERKVVEPAKPEPKPEE